MKVITHELRASGDASAYVIQLGRDGDDVFLRYLVGDVPVGRGWVRLVNRSQIATFTKWWMSKITDLKDGRRAVEFMAVATLEWRDAEDRRKAAMRKQLDDLRDNHTA